jgi:hypothetical protein
MYSFSVSLISTLDWGGWSKQRSGRFTPRGKTRYSLYRRLGGPQSLSGRVRKNLLHYEEKIMSRVILGCILLAGIIAGILLFET